MISFAQSVLISDTCKGIVLKLLEVLGMSDIFLIRISFFCVAGDGGARPVVIPILVLIGLFRPKKEVLTECDRCRPGELPAEEELEDPELCIWRLAGMTIGVLAIILSTLAFDRLHRTETVLGVSGGGLKPASLELGQ